jgi:hypothetical protein
MMEMPPELGLLAEMLDSDKLHVLRQRVMERRYLKSKLERFSERVFFFPVGIQPNLRAPIQIFLNGLCMADPNDFAFRVVGKDTKVAAVIFNNPIFDEDIVQASYENIPPPL